MEYVTTRRLLNLSIGFKFLHTYTARFFNLFIISHFLGLVELFLQLFVFMSLEHRGNQLKLLLLHQVPRSLVVRVFSARPAIILVLLESIIMNPRNVSSILKLLKPLHCLLYFEDGKL